MRNHGARPQRAVGAIEAPIAVEAVRRADLLEFGQAIAQPARRCQIERRARHRLDFSGRHYVAVHRRVVVCIHLDKMILDGAFIVAREVPVGMMREIAHPRRVRFRLHDDGQAVVLVEPVDDPRFDSARIAFLTVARAIGEHDLALRRTGQWRPQPLLEPLCSSMQLMPAPVLCQLVDFAVQLELGIPDAVDHAPAGPPHGERALRVTLHIVEP